VASLIEVVDYYAQPGVRERVREYCGAGFGGAPTCVYLSAISSPAEARRGWAAAPRFPPDALDHLLASGADVARSMWDREHLIFHLDLDYLNVDYPGEPFLHPADTFLKLEPTLQATRRVLHDAGVHTLTLMTGRGYHFTGRIPIEDAVVDRLAGLAPATPGWWPVDARAPEWLKRPMEERLARAFTGLGLVNEFFGQQIVGRVASVSPIPVVFNGTVVGSGVSGRECVSIDLSAAGDPLDVRHLRVAFGAYQRHRFRDDIYGLRTATRVPPLAALPRHGDSTWRRLAEGRDLASAARLAPLTRARLPLASLGLDRAIDEYLESALAPIHRAFYERPPLEPAARHALIARLDPGALPPCVAASLERPNDLLLQPAHLQHVTRYFLGAGWHPRTIAELVLSRYDADFGWGDRWRRLDARTRAEFDVRVFAALVASGLDGALDFNCRSAQEKDLCPASACPHDLRVDRDRLLKVVHS